MAKIKPSMGNTPSEMRPDAEYASVSTGADNTVPARAVERVNRSSLSAIGGIAKSIAATLVIVAACVLAFGANPLSAATALWRGAFGSPFTIGQTFDIAAILALAGIAAAIPFTARLWNVGGEGQIYAGAIGAVTAGLALSGSPGPLVSAAALVAGVVAGALWALIPGLLKAVVGASEMIISLLLNFVAIILARYVIHAVFPDSTGQTTKSIDSAARLPSLIGGTSIDIGIVLVAAVVIVAALVMKYSALGFSIRAVGLGPSAAQLAGFSTSRITVVAFLMAGGVAGLAGALLIVGGIGQLSLGISANYGFLGVAVALVAGLRIAWLPLAALLFAGLTVGSKSLQVATGLPHSLGIVVIGVLILSLLATGAIGIRRTS